MPQTNFPSIGAQQRARAAAQQAGASQVDVGSDGGWLCQPIIHSHQCQGSAPDGQGGLHARQQRSHGQNRIHVAPEDEPAGIGLCREKRDIPGLWVRQ